MKILDRLPIYEEPALIDVWGEVLEIYRNQIIIWVSLAEASRPFPALPDTGHSHNFSIPGRQLERWGRADLKQIGESKVGRHVIPQYRSELFIHADEPGKRRLTGRKHRLRRQSPGSRPGRHDFAPYGAVKDIPEASHTDSSKYLRVGRRRTTECKRCCCNSLGS